MPENIMTRAHHIKRLSEETFDVLVIGGGATGCGIALDAASRGLKTALIERFDFASGTSSRSTKLIHGGVRYLEQAILNFDRSQFALVREALKERMILLQNAPHLTRALPILTPVYQRFELPYYLTGLKLYDRLAGKACLKKSYFLDVAEALDLFPLLRSEGLRGAVVYYDGQFDDARMNITLALTAIEHGAAAANYVEVTGFIKERGRLCGALAHDPIQNHSFSIAAKAVINATGPFVDALRTMDEPLSDPILRTSSGVHLILDHPFDLGNTGLLVPKTLDKRVLFILPWLGQTLVGTTDRATPADPDPKPTDEEIDQILLEVNRYLTKKAGRENIKAAWSGLRPLINVEGKGKTSRLSRDHHIETSPSGLITIAGGKWTTYRRMAEDTVDEAIRWSGTLPLYHCRTESLKLVGAEHFRASQKEELCHKYHFDLDIADHLHHSYGDRADAVAQCIEKGAQGRMVEGYPYLKAEILYAVKEELAQKPVDILARRLRLGFIDSAAMKQAVPTTIALMAKLLGWSDEKKQEEQKAAYAFLSSSH